jgi:hypothetical protein
VRKPSFTVNHARSAYAAPAAARPRASFGNDLTVDRIVRNDNPLLTNPKNPKNMNGIVSAKNAKIEKLVAVVLSTWNTLSPSTQKN